MVFEPRINAVDILTNIFEKGCLLNEHIEKLHLIKADKRDKNLCISLILGVLQNLRMLDWVISRYSKKKDKKIRIFPLNILRISIYSILYLDRVPDYAVVSSCLTMLKGKHNYLKGFFHSMLSKVISEREDILRYMADSEDYSLKYSLPEWFIESLFARFPANIAVNIIKACNEKPGIFIRFSKGRKVHNKALTVSEILDEFYRVNSNDLSEVLPELIKSSETFYIQSLSSGFVSYIYTPRKNERILDLCCGKGGKIIHFMDIYRHLNLNIFAYSHYQKDLSVLMKNLRNWQFTDKIEIIRDLSGLEGLSFSTVYLDIPCSGSGIISKAPDIRYKLSKEYVKELNILQRDLLERAVSLVEKGGHIIYSTCSILEEENIDIVNSQRAYLEIMEINSPYTPKKYISDNYMQVLPDEGMDGITAFLLKKK